MLDILARHGDLLPIWVLHITALRLSFKWLRFPDLTFDGSFILGMSLAYVGVAESQYPFAITLLLIVAGGIIAGSTTSLLYHLVKLELGKFFVGFAVYYLLFSLSYWLLGRRAQVSCFVIEQPFVVFLAVSIILVVGLLVLLHFFGLGLILRFSAYPAVIRQLNRSPMRTHALALGLSNGLVAFSGAFFSYMNRSININDFGVVLNAFVALMIMELVSLFTRQVLFKLNLQRIYYRMRESKLLNLLFILLGIAIASIIYMYLRVVSIRVSTALQAPDLIKLVHALALLMLMFLKAVLVKSAFRLEDTE